MGFRYGIKTTNHSESFNSVLKNAKKLPITACVRATFYRLVKYFESRLIVAEKLVGAGDTWPPVVLEKYLHNEMISNFHRVTIFHHGEGLYEVTTGARFNKGGGNLQTVNINNRSCTCGKFEIYRYPCSHVIKVFQRMTGRALDFVDVIYKSSAMVDTYSGKFYPMLHEDYWPPAPFKLFHNVNRLNHQPGRPRTKRIRNEMDKSRSLRCRACGGSGHNRKNCPAIERLRETSRGRS